MPFVSLLSLWNETSPSKIIRLVCPLARLWGLVGRSVEGVHRISMTGLSKHGHFLFLTGAKRSQRFAGVDNGALKEGSTLCAEAA